MGWTIAGFFRLVAMRVIGLDIGGANLKAADNDGNAVSRPFALWREPARLPTELALLLGTFDRPDCLAVTVTAELCDCFATKSEGIDFILGHLETAADGTEIHVWQTGGEFVPPEIAREIPRLVAAANWHALATFCGRLVPDGPALLIDVGSTTTDVVPLRDGRPVPAGLTDRERLQSGELVYTGIRRTPLCALSEAVILDGKRIPLAAELFATTLDVYLLLGDLPEDEADCDTANGKPATKDAAADRLARMLCCDRTELRAAEIDSLARQFAERQRERIFAAIDRVLNRRTDRQSTPEFETSEDARDAGISCGTVSRPSRTRDRRSPEILGDHTHDVAWPGDHATTSADAGIESPSCVLLSGSGEFLARRIAAEHPALRSARVHSLPQLLSSELSTVACAFAVARLAAERC